MTELQLNSYKEEIKKSIFALHKKRVNKWKLFDTQEKCLEYNIFILSTYINFLDNYFLFGLQSEYNNNIIDYCSLINYSELVNSILGTNYKPTFLTDVVNNKSLIDGGY